MAPGSETPLTFPPVVCYPFPSMSGALRIRALALLLTSFLVLIAPRGTAGDKGNSSATKPTRNPLVRLSLVVPESHAPWRMVLHNRDSVPVRVVADARRLTLLIRGPDDSSYTRCRLPDSMQGSVRKRQLVLPPGQRYVERFDPRLFCWGSVSEKLRMGASVPALLGWEPDERRAKRDRPQVPPFAAEPVLAPPAFAPQKRLASLTHWLPEGDIVQANRKVPERPPRFVGAPDLRLKTHRWAEAITHRHARLTATLRNVGDRSALVHLRPDDLQIRVRRPNGSAVVCEPGPRHRAAVRDFFRTIKPGKSATVRVLLTEHCPRNTFERPGLYELSSTLRVRDDGSHFRLQALTGDFPAPRSTLLRVRDARKPYHRRPPHPHRKGRGKDKPRRGR